MQLDPLFFIELLSLDATLARSFAARVDWLECWSLDSWNNWQWWHLEVFSYPVVSFNTYPCGFCLQKPNLDGVQRTKHKFFLNLPRCLVWEKGGKHRPLLLSLLAQWLRGKWLTIITCGSLVQFSCFLECVMYLTTRGFFTYYA